MLFPRPEKTPIPAPAVGYSGAGFLWRNSGFCGVIRGMPETSSSRTWFETVFELNEPRTWQNRVAGILILCGSSHLIWKAVNVLHLWDIWWNFLTADPYELNGITRMSDTASAFAAIGSLILLLPAIYGLCLLSLNFSNRLGRMVGSN